MKNTNTLTLRKCAYIFDSTYQKRGEDSHKMQKYLERFYYEPELLEQEFKYLFCRNQIAIEILGTTHSLNDIQIAHINGELENSPINHRKIIEAKSVAENTPNFHLFCDKFLYHNKLTSMYFDFFTENDSLGYIRGHFKTQTYEFMVDKRTNIPYGSGRYGRHVELLWDYIKTALCATSKQASAAFDEMANAITNA